MDRTCGLLIVLHPAHTFMRWDELLREASGDVAQSAVTTALN
jgi:hypothetical protein